MPSLRRAGISLGLMLAVWSTDATSQSKTVAQCFHEDQRLHFGPEGLIVHHTVTVDANGVEHVENEYGDTAQREGWFWVGEWIRQEKLKLKPTARKLSFQEVLNLLEPNRDDLRAGTDVRCIWPRRQRSRFFQGPDGSVGCGYGSLGAERCASANVGRNARGPSW
jgi:hypothetical protein